jgi:hypothetical protein
MINRAFYSTDIRIRIELVAKRLQGSVINLRKRTDKIFVLRKRYACFSLKKA